MMLLPMCHPREDSEGQTVKFVALLVCKDSVARLQCSGLVLLLMHDLYMLYPGP